MSDTNIKPIFAESVDYIAKASLHSSYRWMKLTPVGGGGQSATLSNTSSIIVNFEIPNNCMNLSLSKLCFDMAIAAASGGKSTNVDALGLSLFDRISLSTRSGVVLASADNMGQFCHLVSKIKNKVIDLIDNPSSASCRPQGSGGLVSQPLLTFPNLTPINSSSLFSSKKPYTDICKSGAVSSTSMFKSMLSSVGGTAVYIQSIANNPSSLYRIDGSFNSTPFLENLHVITENKIDATAAGLAVSYQIPLKAVKDTILEVNKSLYFGDNLILSLSFNPTSKFSWLSTSGIDGGQAQTQVVTGLTQIAINPSVGGAGVGVTPVQWTPNAGSAVAVNTAALTNLALYIAVETDPIVTSQLINKVNGAGFVMTIPYVYCTKSPVNVSAILGTAAPSTSSFSMQQRITRGYGHRLLRCYSAIFGAEGITAGNMSIMDNSHAFPNTIADGATVMGVGSVTGFTTNQHSDLCLGGYNTTLDGIRLQDFTVSASDSTHWLINEPYLRGSCILTLDQYKNQCCHVDSWTGKPVCEEDDTIDNGLSLDADKTYGVSYQTLYNTSSSTQLNHYLFFVVQRVLAIKGNIIGLV